MSGISPKDISMEDSSDKKVKLSNCNKLTDKQWQSFFNNYINWIRDNIDECLKEHIYVPITFDELNNLPFEKGGFDLKSFLQKDEIETIAEKNKFLKAMNLYDGYLENIKSLRVNDDSIYLTQLNRIILYNLCEALQSQLKQYEYYVFYSTMIFFMEIMCCQKVLDAFIKSSSKGYYNIISECKIQIFGITKNNTVGYFIVNYARRLLSFTLTHNKQFMFSFKLPVLKNPEYTLNLKVAILPKITDPEELSIEDSSDKKVKLSYCNRLTDKQWQSFFNNYINWIRDNINKCLKEYIYVPITFDKLSKLPFERGGFDLESFLKKDEIARSSDKDKFLKAMNLYDGYLENIKSLRVNGEGTYLTQLNRIILYNLCEALQSQLKKHSYVFYSRIIFFMEIMCCRKVFNAFITYAKSDSNMKSSSKGYYNIISECKLQVFGITNNNIPSPVNNTVGYFIVNYARRLLSFTLTHNKQFMFSFKLPVVKNPKYTPNLKVAILPKITDPEEYGKRETSFYFIPGQKQTVQPFHISKVLLDDLITKPALNSQLKNYKKETYPLDIDDPIGYDIINPYIPPPKNKLKKIPDDNLPIAKRTRTRKGGKINNKNK